MTRLPVVLASYEDLDRSAYSRARMARALVRQGLDVVFLGPPRRPSAGELAKLALAGGDWSPAVQRDRADGVGYLEPLDLPARRIRPLGNWDARTSLAALSALGPQGWVVVYPTGSGKPPALPHGWRLCWYLTDEFAADNPHFARREEPLLDECDLLVGVSASIVERRRARAPRTLLLPNGYDDALFPPDGPRPTVDGELAAIPHPRIGYVGAPSPTKVDLELVGRLARARPAYHFVFAGPPPEGAPARALDGLDNVHVLAPRPFEQAPALVAGLDVAFLPYRDTAVNRCCSPLKAREALALGVPVVSTPVEELQEHPGAAFVGADDDALLRHLDAVVAGDVRPDPDAVRWFTAATWDVRAAEFAAALRAPFDRSVC